MSVPKACNAGKFFRLAMSRHDGGCRCCARTLEDARALKASPQLEPPLLWLLRRAEVRQETLARADGGGTDPTCCVSISAQAVTHSTTYPFPPRSAKNGQSNANSRVLPEHGSGSGVMSESL